MLHDAPHKILIITSEFPPDPGGIGNQAFNLASHLAKNNFRVTVLADIVYASKKDVGNTRKFENLNLRPVYRNKFIPFTYYRRIQKAIVFSRKHDAIIFSGKFSIWLTGLLKLLFAKKKFISVVHGTELGLTKSWQRLLINYGLTKSDSVIAVSNFTKSLLASSVTNKIKCFVIPNGIDMQEYSGISTPGKKEVHPGTQNLQLITVGSVSERKGQENVLRALPGIIRKFPGTRYHLVGRISHHDKIMELINSKKMNEYVVFHGVVERPRLLQLLSEADIKIMLSNNTASGDVEGFGIAVLEANVLGVPAIGSKNTGLEDAIKNNETGILVDPKNIDEINEAIRKILNDYNFFSANAKQWSMQHDWRLIVKKYIEVINA